MQKGFAPIIVVIGIVGLILVGGAGWYFMSRGSEVPASSTTPAAEETTSDDASVSESTETMSALIGRGQNLECDWRMPIEAADNPFNTGKLWTTGNMGRSQISGTIAGGAMEGNAIFKDSEVYTWMAFGGQKVGFRMSESDLADASAGMTAEQRQQAEQISREMIFNCRPWTPDASLFEIPSDVTFR